MRDVFLETWAKSLVRKLRIAQEGGWFRSGLCQRIHCKRKKNETKFLQRDHLSVPLIGDGRSRTKLNSIWMPQCLVSGFTWERLTWRTERPQVLCRCSTRTHCLSTLGSRPHADTELMSIAFFRLRGYFSMPVLLFRVPDSLGKAERWEFRTYYHCFGANEIGALAER